MESRQLVPAVYAISLYRPGASGDGPGPTSVRAVQWVPVARAPALSCGHRGLVGDGSRLGRLALRMPWVVPVLFGESFREAIAPALILLLAYIFIGLKNIVIQSLRGLGEGSLAYMAVAVSVGLFLAVAWPLGSSLGLWGVGLAMGVANLGAVVYLAFLLHRRFRIHLSELWGLDPGTVS